MKYHFLDPYREADSLIHRLDPRAKFLATLVLVSAIVLAPRDGWLSYGLFLVLNLVLLLLSRVPLFYVLKRSLVVFPFVLMIAIFMPFKEGTEVFGANIGRWHVGLSHEGLVLTASVFCKTWLSVVALILITATTSISDLLKGLERLKMPAIMVMLMGFMYRYLFVISDEAGRLSQARNSRSVGGGIRLHVRTLGYMAGALFLRSYERGERIYGAMLSRGFDGYGRSLNQLSMQWVDVFYMAVVMALSLLIAISPLLVRNLSG